ncbi:MAG: Coenzyme F420 hydrogenase/dehydrogenase, beta subunit C-terminal domain [Hyphomonas sp.]
MTQLPYTPALRGPEPRGLCTDCGISRMADAKACGRACQFIQPDYPAQELRLHGRMRNDQTADETHFGVFRRMLRARLSPAKDGAQWTGIATTLGERLLANGKVDAVLAVAPDPEDRWKPKPVIVTRAEDMAQCRGMRMGYSPLIALMEEVAARGFKRIALIGIPCQVYALRALEAEFGLEKLYVIGTPCSDNTTTENFHDFLKLLDPAPETISYLEFRADFRVELRFDDGRTRLIPFLSLPISKLPRDFFPLTCRTCVDYTNALSDLTVGYMGGEGEQWLIVRNDRGEELVELLGASLVTAEPGSKGKRAPHVAAFIKNVELAAGGLPLRSMPNWVRPIVSFLQPRIGPKGLEFARTRLEMKAAETVIHLRREEPAKLKNMVPAHVWKLLEAYGISPKDGERKEPG